MGTREEIYKERIAKFDADLKKARGQASRIVALRVAEFLIGGLLSYYLFDIHDLAGIAGILGTLAVFLVLVKKHEQIKLLIRYYRAIIELNRSELLAMEGDYTMFADGTDYLTEGHDFAHDLDLFGDRSVYQWMNRTVTKEGQRFLATELANPSFGTEVIRDKQVAVQELAEMFEWRQDFYAKGKVYHTELGEKKEINNWLENRSDYTSAFWVKASRLLFPVTSAAAIVLYSLGEFSFFQMLIVLSVPLAVTSTKIKITNKQHELASKYQSAMDQQGQLLEKIESYDFKSKYLRERLTRIEVEGQGAGKSLQTLASIVGALDNRANPFVGIGLNSLLMWDFHSMTKLERWLDTNGPKLEGWIDMVAEFDAILSYAQIAWNNPEYAYPELSDEKVMEAKGLGHPLLPKKNRVDNDFSINSQGDFVIITGANMAGKSTFLRSVGVNLILGRCGAPVCATEMTFKPLKLFTSMRTTDSLQENESYFYTELKRLNMIVQLQESGEELFIILDEILKGTNSKDKASGSKKFIEKLVRLRSTGIIATHDLSLCELESTMPSVRNACFEVEFGEDDLVFDYTLRPGVCKNMNATWLMEKMKII